VIKQVFIFVAFLSLLSGVNAQKDSYDQLRTQYDSLRIAKHHEEALVVAKQMNDWALKNETDTSLRYAVSLRYIANSYLPSSMVDSGILYLNKSLSILSIQNRMNHLDYAEVINTFGLLYYLSGQYESAEYHYLKVLNIKEAILGSKNSNYAETLNDLGNLYFKMKQFKNAEHFYKKYLEINSGRLNENDLSFVICMNNLGDIYYEMNYFDSAEVCYKIVLEKYKILIGEENQYYSESLLNLGNVYLQKADFYNSESILKKASELIYKVLGKYHPIYGACMNSLGIVYKKIGDLKKAEYFSIEALDIYEKLYGIEHPNYSSCVGNLGNLYSDIGNYELAKIYTQKALELRKKILGEEHKDYMASLFNFGVLNWNMGCYKEAEFFCNQSLELIKKIFGEQNFDFANSKMSLGLIYQSIGDFSKAEDFFNEALMLFQNLDTNLNTDYANCLQNLGNLHLDLMNLKSAESFLSRSQEIFKSKIGNNIDLAVVMNNLAVLNKLKGDYNRSILFLNEALAIYIKELGENHPYIALSYNNLGDLYFLKKDYGKAKNYYNLSFEMIKKLHNEEHPDYAISLTKMGIVFSKVGDYLSASPYFEQALNIKKRQLSTNFIWLSELQKKAYWQNENSFFEEININTSKASLEVPQSTEFSYNVCLISKSLLLETSRELDQAITQSSDEEIKTQFLEMKQLRKLYSKMQSEGSTNKEIMERYKTQADSLDKILVNKLGKYAASKRKFEITWKDVQSNLATTDAAIEFARYYDDKDSLYKYMALVVRPDYEYPKLISLGEEDAIRTAAQNKDFSALYNEAWKGIDSLLVGVKRVYYSPAGELNNVSFSALCTEEGNELVASNKEKNRGVVIGNNKTTTKACNLVLMDKYELHQLTTTRYLADGTLKKEKPMQPSLAVVGGINFDDIPDKTIEADKEQSNEDFAFHANLNKQSTSTNGKKRGKRSSSNYGKKMDPLPGTKEEVVNIAGLLNTSNWKVQTKSDKKAGEYEFKKELETKAPSVLHIATHGFAFPDEAKKESKLMDMNQTSTYKVSEDPMVRCGLMLGGSNISWTGNPQKMIEQTGDDGILTAAEVANLDLSNTKLVVLSACETGLGKIEGSEGTFGLKRGFKLAGVEQMIVSLWSVPDNETMELMTLFYSDLTKTLNPVTSFSNAQKEMRDKYPTDPEKWAGFVLVR